MDKKESIVNRFSATQVELAKYVKIEPIEFEDRKGWVGYGEGNAFPQYLIELYNTSPVHGALVNSIAFMIAGKEFTASTTLAVREIQRLKLDKILKATALDLKLQGGFYWEVIWSMDRSTIAQINHLPYENCRLACSDDNDDITGVWYSRDWNDMRKKKNAPHYIPMFDINTKNENPKQVLFQHSMMIGSEYYPKPDYIGSINWIELTRQISEYHVNNILNGFFPSIIASFNNGIPTLEEQRMIKQQLQLSIQGAENAGKVLTFFNEERDRGVEFSAFPISDADKQYEFLSGESTNQILVGHRVTSPLLFGIRDGGGLGSNTDEMKTSFRLFSKQVIDPFQRIICDGVDTLFNAMGIPSDVQIVENDLFMEAEIVAPTEVVTQSNEKKKVECKCINFLNLGGEGSGCTGDNCGRPSGLSENEKNEVFNLANSTAEKLGLSKNDYHISFGKTPNGLGAYTTFEGTSDGKWVMSPKIVIKDTGDINYQKRIVQHELRHIYQSKEKGFYITKDGIHYENKLHITTKEYNKILNGMSKAKTKEDYLKFKQKYTNLPWERDADNFAGINHEFSSILKDLKLKDLPIDLIELPFKVLEEHKDVSKICCSAEGDFTDEEGKGFLKQLAECGELIDTEEWELVEEEEVTDYDGEEKFAKVHQGLESYEDADAKSKLDAGVYKVRYRYSTWIGENSREFCREMVRLSKGGIVWRYEDIIEMGDAGVNGQFARQGTTTYNLFRFKGGVNCHHFWMRAIYKRKKEKGRYLPNDGMDNDMKIAVRKAEKEGFSPMDTTVGYRDAKTPMKDFPNGGRLTK